MKRRTGQDRSITDTWRPATRAVRGGTVRSEFGETSEAIFMTSGYAYDCAGDAAARFAGEQQGMTYSRLQNPTVGMLEHRIALLEGAEACRTTASGMAAMTAALLFVGSAALLLLPRHRAAAAVLAALQAAAGLAIVAAHALDGPVPGWLPQAWWSSRLTGGAFFLSGLATLLPIAGRVILGQALALGVLVFFLLLGLGHVVPAADLYAALPGTGVAIPTILSFVAFSVAQLLRRRESGLLAALTSRSTAGKAGMRLLISGMAVILFVTLGLTAAQRRGNFDPASALLLLGWCAVAVLMLTLWALAMAVDRAESARATAEEERNRLRTMVAAAVTHDLRSPLQAAVLATALLQRQAREPAASASLARLQRSHTRLDRLLRTLLDSLAIEQGRHLPLDASAVALAALVRDVVEENDTVLGPRVAVEGDADGWWDRDALFRVVENLLLNAVKYGDAASVIECRISRSATQAVLEVENQGTPVPAVEWESIFLPFSRGERVQDAAATGWGVGLAYARSVAAGHGGSIRLQSSDAAGTVFRLALPLDSRPFLQATRGEAVMP